MLQPWFIKENVKYQILKLQKWPTTVHGLVHVHAVHALVAAG